PGADGGGHRRGDDVRWRERRRSRREREVEKRRLALPEDEMVLEESPAETRGEHVPETASRLAREPGARHDDEYGDTRRFRAALYRHRELGGAGGREHGCDLGAELVWPGGEQLGLRERVEGGDDLLVVVAPLDDPLGGEQLAQAPPEERHLGRLLGHRLR